MALYTYDMSLGSQHTKVFFFPTVHSAFSSWHGFCSASGKIVIYVANPLGFK